MSNAGYFDQLCIKREKELKDPDDVLFDAEKRKKEKAEEEIRMKGSKRPPARNPRITSLYVPRERRTCFPAQR